MLFRSTCHVSKTFFQYFLISNLFLISQRQMLQEANAASASASQTETQPVVQGEVDDQNCTDGDGENVEGEEDDDEEDDHAPIPRLPNPRGGVAPPPTGKPPFPAQRIADLRKRRHEEQFGTESEEIGRAHV